MIKKSILAITVVLTLCIGFLNYLVAPHVATPKFVVKNDSSESVSATAHWRDKVKALGDMPAGSEIEFEINDEAAMEFQATFSGGRVISSSPGVYFTSGTKINAVITDSSIEISLD